VGCLFNFETISFVVQKLFNFSELFNYFVLLFDNFSRGVVYQDCHYTKGNPVGRLQLSNFEETNKKKGEI
jgi:hypothetical protein